MANLRVRCNLLATVRLIVLNTVFRREVGKNKWIPLSEVLRPKGIKLTDLNGVGGTGTGRVL